MGSWDNALERRLRALYAPGRAMPATPAVLLDDSAIPGPEGHVHAPAVVRVVAEDSNPHFLRLSGRLVEAEVANSNGALWASDDLRAAVPTVPYGPLNWLHEERRIIGALTAARFVAVTEEAGPHIEIDAVAWRFLWPHEAAAVERASAEGTLWSSMECVSETVTCMSCGGSFPYLDAIRATSVVCEHVRQQSSVRRFDNPVFLGAAVVVPPARPGWSGASIRVQDAPA